MLLKCQNFLFLCLTAAGRTHEEGSCLLDVFTKDIYFLQYNSRNCYYNMLSFLAAFSNIVSGINFICSLFKWFKKNKKKII